ncbi:unnamed protein product [Rotaria socialis]|uniref:Uncharacterized protein n=1 Tax=Rotaria socialis TaxID=392032 RepID=A0A820WJF4_9BILA|nr:unnamed protein product [Rotaria socialis]CAF4548052.1 unnamed protein product [Rotaria socialis]
MNHDAMKKVAVIFDSIDNLLKENDFSLIDKENYSPAPFHLSLVYRYKNVDVNVILRKRKNTMFLTINNDEIQLDKQITLDIDYYVKKDIGKFVFDNAAQFNHAFNTLINAAKTTIDHLMDSNAMMISHSGNTSLSSKNLPLSSR